MKKKLYRSKNEKKLAGVCGGIGEFFDIDPTLVRMAWVMFALFAGSGLIAYVIAALIIPERPMVE